ncbi:MAG: hypothetical protein AAF602_06885 [Myxococcota bacterium]
MLRLPSRLMLPLAVAVGGLLVIGAVWFFAQTQVRFALWQSVAERPLTPGEGKRLGRCDRTPGWWTWVKVLHNDRPVPCGEGWAIDRMADKIRRSDDRRRWVRQYVEAPDTLPARRLRATLLLNVVGEATPEEPAWLSTVEGAHLTPDEGAERIQAQAWPWAIHLGPGVVARGTMAGMTVAGFAPTEVVTPFEALWALDDPEVDQNLVRWAAAGLSVPPSLSADRWYRRRQGRPSSIAPRGWSRLVLGRSETCPSDDAAPSEACLTLWRDLLVHESSTERNPFEHPLLPRTLPDLLPVMEPMGWRTRAMEWWMQSAEDWIRAAPDPDQRLASLARGTSDRAETAHPLAVLDRRAGTPFVTAAVLQELGQRTDRDVDVRVDDDGTLWLSVGDEVATRPRCGRLAAAAPSSAPWRAAAVTAGALIEVAAAATDPLEQTRLRAAAHALAPELATAASPPTNGDPDATGEDTTNAAVAFSAGQRLLPRRLPRVSPPERRSLGSQIGTPCEG